MTRKQNDMAKTATVRMLTHITGVRNGEEWPLVGGTVTVPVNEAEDLVAAGHAEPVDGTPVVSDEGDTDATDPEPDSDPADGEEPDEEPVEDSDPEPVDEPKPKSKKRSRAAKK